MRKVVGFAALFAIGLSAYLGFSDALGQIAPQDEVAKRFIGMWRLVSGPLRLAVKTRLALSSMTRAATWPRRLCRSTAT